MNFKVSISTPSMTIQTQVDSLVSVQAKPSGVFGVHDAKVDINSLMMILAKKGISTNGYMSFYCPAKRAFIMMAQVPLKKKCDVSLKLMVDLKRVLAVIAGKETATLVFKVGPLLKMPSQINHKSFLN